MRKKYWKNGYGAVILLAIIIGFGFLFVPGFRRPGMYFNVLDQASISGVIALGMLFVLICGDIDLSLNAQYSLYGSLCATFIKTLGIPMPLAVLLTVFIALFIGLLIGWTIDSRGLNPMIATIAAGVVISGFTYILVQGLPVFNIPSNLTQITSLHFGVFSFSDVLFLMIALLTALILYGTYWGKFFYAIGCDIDAARKTGVPVRTSRMLAFALCSMFCAVASVVYMGRIGLASPSSSVISVEDLLTILALAGVSFYGGRGRVVPVFCASITLAMLAAVFLALQVPLYYQTLMKGLILLLAISTKFTKT